MVNQHDSCPRDVSVSTLSNGIRVISETMPAVRSVAVGLWVGTGSRSESARENGISHFIEHMLFKGTPRRSAEEIARAMDSLGGHLDAFTGKELVGFNTKVLDEHLPAAFDVLADMVLNPRFDESDIEKEKGVILEELKMENDNPEYLIHEIFTSSFWRKHPLGRPIIGTRKTITSFDAGVLRGYHHRFYAPSNITITAAGSLRHEELVALAESHFSAAVERGERPLLSEPVPHPFVELRSKRSLQQLHLCIGAPFYPASHPMRFTCYVLNVILGGGMSSRLFQNIRERQGLVYSVFSELNLYRDTGCLGVYAGTSKENARRVIDCILDEFRELKRTPVDEEELRRAKDHMKGSLMLSLESTSSRMGNLARQALYFGRFYSLDEIVDSIERVSTEDVLAVANEFLQPEKLALTVLGKLDTLRLERADLEC
jgi:predicted Zn-dependent peptidase